MNLSLKRVMVWGVWLLLAVALLWPAVPSFAGTLPAPLQERLTQVAQLRQEGKAKDALPILDQAAKDAGRDRVAGAAVTFVQAEIYHNDLKDQKKAAGYYSRLTRAAIPDQQVVIPGYPGTVDIQERALEVEDTLNQARWQYRLMATLTHAIGQNPITGRMLQSHSGVLAIFLLTVAIKLVLTPLTKKSFVSMREMQKVQPLMKQLQQRYKDKPQELNQRMMELYKEHGVNPLSGCLPMLLQMPIIILLWQAIGYFQYPLSKESFLWIGKLSHADMPLALIYAASLFLSSKLTMMPAADPQQEAQQKMMAYMMPAMFFFLFQGYPAGFILGWLFFNLLTTAQQWHLMRGMGAAEGAGGAGASLSLVSANDGGSDGSGGSASQKPTGTSGARRNGAKLQQTSKAIRRRRNTANRR